MLNTFTSEMIANGGILRLPDALKKITKLEEGATYKTQCSHDIWIEPYSNEFDFRPNDPEWFKKTVRQKD